ncbi:MAG: NYN domain-containing protein [Clostridia bacterium]
MKENNRVAVFIDAENISAKLADKLFEEASNYGDVIVKRVFADWSKTHVQQWREAVSKHSLIAEQQFSAVRGKNSSDISLIIDVLVTLFERNIDVFCLASSDSDFTRLVQELRERQKTVIGFGLKQTVQEFVNAFSEFVYLDEKQVVEEIEPKPTQGQVVSPIKETKKLLNKERMTALTEILDRLIEANGKAFYSLIAAEMKNKYSDFIPKNYGCKSMKEFMNKVMENNKKYKIETDTDGTTLFIKPLK